MWIEGGQLSVFHTRYDVCRYVCMWWVEGGEFVLIYVCRILRVLMNWSELEGWGFRPHSHQASRVASSHGASRRVESQIGLDPFST